MRLTHYLIALVLFGSCSVVHQNGMYQSRKYRVFKKKTKTISVHPASRNTSAAFDSSGIIPLKKKELLLPLCSSKPPKSKESNIDKAIGLLERRTQEPTLLADIEEQQKEVRRGPMAEVVKTPEPQPEVHPALDLGIVFGLLSVLSIFFLAITYGTWALSIPVFSFLVLGSIGLCIALLTRAFRDARNNPDKYAYKSFTLLALITSYFYATLYLFILFGLIFW
ncbi:hypothetical protein GYB22_03810 [bacterium]|nr:hypothetical protein [bacterium]